MRSFIFISILFSLGQVRAVEIAQVKHIDIESKRIAFEIKEGRIITDTQSLILTNKQGNQCSFKIESIKDNLAIAKINVCAWTSEIEVGQPAEIGLFENDRPSQKTIDPKMKSGIDSLMFFPPLGTSLLAISFTKLESKAEESFSGTIFSEDKWSFTKLDLLFERPITKRFSLSVNFDYLFESKTTYDISSALSTPDFVVTSKGIGDPNLDLRYRMSDQSNSKTNVDLILSVSPTAGKAQYATEDASGNNFRGGTNVKIRTVVGSTVGGGEILGAISYTTLGEREAVSAEDKSKKIKLNATDAFDVNVIFRLILSENSNLHLGGLYSITGESYKTYADGTQPITTDSVSGVNILLGYSLSLNNEDALMSINLIRGAIDDYQYEQSGTIIDVKKHSGTSLSLSLSTLF